MEEFRKVYALVPKSLYERLREQDVFKKNFDSIVCELLLEYLDRSDKNEFNRIVG
jgi:hypothetical protein